MLNFNSLSCYKLKNKILFSKEIIEKKLKTFSFKSCGKYEYTRIGWSDPLSFNKKNNELAYIYNNKILMCIKKEEKILPRIVILQELNKYIKEYEKKNKKKISNEEKKNIKEEIINNLIKKAFSKFTKNMLWIDIDNDLIIINTANIKDTENIISLLRKSLGSLQIEPLIKKEAIEITLTNWIMTQKLPSNFSILKEAELKDIIKDNGTIKCTNQNLISEEIFRHIKAGKRVTKIGLIWNKKIQFVLSNSGTLQRIKFVDKNYIKKDIKEYFDFYFNKIANDISLIFNCFKKTMLI
ncbi:recombination-associated protein RdgC [Buchnera aphidicola (Taiwanaphis decaspermi)]|uniref:recombination-associated protein RdgC n=1 Tax=Buchnera aphidicola TaxID=9 RepID=UPI0031B7F34C